MNRNGLNLCIHNRKKFKVVVHTHTHTFMVATSAISRVTCNLSVVLIVFMSYCIRRFHSRNLQMMSSSESKNQRNDPIILS